MLRPQPCPAKDNANIFRNQLAIPLDDGGTDSTQAWDGNTNWLDLNFIDWVRLPIPFSLSQDDWVYGPANKEQPYSDSIIGGIGWVLGNRNGRLS